MKRGNGLRCWPLKTNSSGSTRGAAPVVAARTWSRWRAAWISSSSIKVRNKSCVIGGKCGNDDGAVDWAEVTGSVDVEMVV